jgi:hypothetical protein
MSEGYPMAVVRADGDDVAAWLARRGVPAEVVAGPEGWVSVEGLTEDDLDALADLAGELRTTAIVFATEGDSLTVEVLGTDPAIAAASDDGAALAAAAGHPEWAAKITKILRDPALGVSGRHRTLAEVLGLPGRLPRHGAARAEATGAPLEPAGAAGPGKEAQPTPSSVALPAWLPVIVLWTGVGGMALAVFAAVVAETGRGLIAAGLAGLAACACVVLGMVGRSVNR